MNETKIPAGWQGLTYHERAHFVGELCEYDTDFVAPLFSIVDAIADKLKERNAASPVAAEEPPASVAPATASAAGWTFEHDEIEGIRVRAPDGEVWWFRDHQDGAYGFIYRMLEAIRPAPSAAAVQAEPADESLALDLLELLFDAYDDGTPCYEDPDDHTGYLGRAVRMEHDEFQRAAELLNRRRPRDPNRAATQPQATEREALSDEQIDQHLDAVLRASGSALRHYSMQKSKDDMRAAMRAAILAGLTEAETSASRQSKGKEPPGLEEFLGLTG